MNRCFMLWRGPEDDISDVQILSIRDLRRSHPLEYEFRDYQTNFIQGVILGGNFKDSVPVGLHFAIFDSCLTDNREISEVNGLILDWCAKSIYNPSRDAPQSGLLVRLCLSKDYAGQRRSGDQSGSDCPGCEGHAVLMVLPIDRPP